MVVLHDNFLQNKGQKRHVNLSVEQNRLKAVAF